MPESAVQTNMTAPGIIPIVLGLTLSCAGLRGISATPVIDVCPPFNSSLCLSDIPVTDTCNSDSQCPRSTKCCCSQCGRKCVTPIQVKPGLCPSKPAECLGPASPPKCQWDSCCPGKQRCCDSCGRICQDPEPEPITMCRKPEITLIDPPCSSIRCASDSECPAGKKCCPQVEGWDCVKPPLALNAQDMCPSAKDQRCTSPQGDECHSDRQCPSSQKCCCSNCGWKCVAPIKVKPGRCPGRDPMCRGMKSPECGSDIDCPETQKCCDVCGYKCADPVPEPPGICPVSDMTDVHSLQCTSVMCSSNADCSAERKCCLTDDNQKCVKPSPVVVAICPPFNPDTCLGDRNKINKCLNDSDCKSPMKCCCSNCRWKCVAPVLVKPGRCPPIKAKCPAGALNPKCQSDSNCPRNEKCCDICGGSCWPPDPEPYGSCPMKETTKQPQCSAARCSRDTDCAADEKCCTSDEGQKCVKPYPAVQSVCPRSRPGSCPAGNEKPDECSNDAQCQRNKKCCCSACGRKCVTPVQVKPGRCPHIPYMCAGLRSEFSCESDTDCPLEDKCCNICGSSCHTPDPGPMGVCPATQTKEKTIDCPSVLCTSDSDCGVREKCCLSEDKRQCVLPVEELSPSGMLRVCPAFDSAACLRNISYPNECRSDVDCAASQKCCCADCTLKCQTPVEVKPGRCPEQSPSRSDLLTARKCLTDKDCPRDHKCCPSLGNKCWKPVPEPPGTCKAAQGPQNPTCSSIRCTSNGDCPLLLKCCPITTGQRCIFQVEDIQ